MGYDRDEDSSDYRCCVGCMHVKNAAWLIGLLVVIGGCIELYYAYPLLMAYTSERTTILVLVFLSLAFFFSEVLFFLGLRNNKPGFLIKHMMFQVVSIVYILFYAGYKIYWLVKVYEMYEDKESSPDSGWVWGEALFLIGCMTSFVLAIWFFIVVVQVFHYLKDQK